MLNLPITRDGFVWALSISSQIHHVPLATTLSLQKYEAPFTLGSFRVVAEQCGFKVRQKAVPNSQLAKLPLPCLVALIPGVEGVSFPTSETTAVTQSTMPEYQMALLQSIDDESVVFAEACSKSTMTLSRQAFEKCFAGEALIISPAPTESVGASRTGKNADGNAKKESGNIGVTWFKPQVGWFKSMFRGTR
ncbi:MAG: hypothetical protein V4568_16760 [Pseudomonadota bacterium]